MSSYYRGGSTRGRGHYRGGGEDGFRRGRGSYADAVSDGNMNRNEEQQRGERYRSHSSGDDETERGSGGFESNSQCHAGPPLPLVALESFLRDVDGSNYSQLKQLTGRTYSLTRQMRPDPASVSIRFVRIQPDPFAPGSQVCVSVPAPFATHTLLHSAHSTPPGVTAAALGNPLPPEDVACRRVAAEDFILRCVKGGFSAGPNTSGAVQIIHQSQHVIARSAVQLLGASEANDSDGASDGWIHVYFRVKLPGHGRRIDSQRIRQILFSEVLPVFQENVLRCDHRALWAHVTCVHDQEWLRAQLREWGFAAFIADGAILPRAAGNSDKPLSGPSVVAFSSPATLQHTFQLPYSGRAISGAGLPHGLTLIAGGGFHGKSTLLRALELGVYNHVPDDGRTFVVVDPTAVKIRAEDRRAVHGTDISPFITNLPYRDNTTAFVTADASGSTSQAANIMEALELGSTTLLLDEDTSAANFMYRDPLMEQQFLYFIAYSLRHTAPTITTVAQRQQQRGKEEIRRSTIGERVQAREDKGFVAMLCTSMRRAHACVAHIRLTSLSTPYASVLLHKTPATSLISSSTTTVTAAAAASLQAYAMPRRWQSSATPYPGLTSAAPDSTMVEQPQQPQQGSIVVTYSPGSGAAGNGLTLPTTALTGHCDVISETLSKADELLQQKKAQEALGTGADILTAEGIDEMVEELKEITTSEVEVLVGQMRSPAVVQQAGMHELRRTLYYATSLKARDWIEPAQYTSLMRVLTVELLRRDSEGVLAPDDVLYVTTHMITANFYNRHLWNRMEKSLLLRNYDTIDMATIKALSTKLFKTRRGCAKETLDVRRKILSAMTRRVAVLANDFDLPSLLGILQCYTIHDMTPPPIQSLAVRATNHVSELTPQECATLSQVLRKFSLLRLEVCERLIERICTADELNQHMVHSALISIRTCYNRVSDSGRNALQAEPTRQKLRAMGEQVSCRLQEATFPTLNVILNILDIVVNLRIYVPKKSLQSLFTRALDMVKVVVEQEDDLIDPTTGKRVRPITMEQGRQLHALLLHYGSDLCPDLQTLLKQCFKDGLLPDEASI